MTWGDAEVEPLSFLLPDMRRVLRGAEREDSPVGSASSVKSRVRNGLVFQVPPNEPEDDFLPFPTFLLDVVEVDGDVYACASSLAGPGILELISDTNHGVAYSATYFVADMPD